MLADAFGEGEYLDKQTIALAKLEASTMGGRLRYLPVVKLALLGFVVDAGPFLGWFNPMRLRRIEFKHNCIDAGFALPASLASLVNISRPGGEQCRVVKMTPVAKDQLHMTVLGKEKTVQQAAGSRPKINAMLVHRWFSKTNRGTGHRVDAKPTESVQDSSSLTSMRLETNSDTSGKSQN